MTKATLMNQKQLDYLNQLHSDLADANEELIQLRNAAKSNKPLINSYEANTGGGTVVTVVECDAWDYVMVYTDEFNALFKDAESYFNGGDALAYSTPELYGDS
tara:strand:- start:464 stop:772 length:309 start_codon:yes stop_codon:yes gene_type:complete